MATAEQEPGGVNQSQHRWDILEHDYRPNREPQETGEQETRKRDTLQSSTPWFFLSAEKGSWTLSDKWRSCLWKYHVLYCFVQCAFSSRSLLCNILLISQPPPARDPQQQQRPGSSNSLGPQFLESGPSILGKGPSPKKMANLGGKNTWKMRLRIFYSF